MSKKNKIRKIINIITGAEKRKPKYFTVIDGKCNDKDYPANVRPDDIVIHLIKYKPKNQNNE